MKIIGTILLIIICVLFSINDTNNLDAAEAKCKSLGGELTRTTLPINCVIVNKETLEIKKIHNTDLKYY